MKTAASDIIAQLQVSGVIHHAIEWECIEHQACVRGRMTLGAIEYLRQHPQFQQGPLHRLHRDVGDDLTEFRSFRGAFAKGRSLQLVIDKTTGAFYADLDAFSPYADLVGWLGHSGEVLRGWFRRLKAG